MFTTLISLYQDIAGDKYFMLVRAWLDCRCTWDCSVHESKELLEEIAWCVN